MGLKEIVLASIVALGAAFNSSCVGNFGNMVALGSRYISRVTAIDKPLLVGNVCMPEHIPPIDTKWYTKIDYTNPKLTEKLDQGHIDDYFLARVSDMCTELDMHCMGVLSVMDYETGGTFNPSKKNMAGSGAVGLIQFMPSTAKDLGTSVQKLSRMTKEEQMDYVGEYFKRVIVDLKNKLQIIGTLKAFDIHINVVLNDGEERENGELKRKLGTVFIRGDTIILISPA